MLAQSHLNDQLTSHQLTQDEAACWMLALASKLSYDSPCRITLMLS